MGGTSTGAAQKEQKAQDVIQQTKTLQSNIHRIEKEIEALEREELNISTNEGLILHRLKAIEKSTADIIKAANENFKSEPIQVYSGIPDAQKSYTPLNMRKQTSVDQRLNYEQQKPALLAMEINVQKDLRTGKSHVLSTCTVPAQELQQRGIKVYDDGRKSVYALHSALDQPEPNGVDELSPKEVEELLKQATEKRKKHQDHHEPPHLKHYQHSPCSELYNVEMNEWPEYNHRSIHHPYQEIQEPACDFTQYSDQHENYHNSNGKNFEMYGSKTRCDPRQMYDPCERHRRTDSQHVNHIPPLSYREEDPQLSVLNTLPSDEPVTMIFMGYQNAEEVTQDTQSYEGSIQAELVIIGDGEEETSTSAAPFQIIPTHSLLNCNTNNASTQLSSETPLPACLEPGVRAQGRPSYGAPGAQRVKGLAQEPKSGSLAILGLEPRPSNQ
ncbi:palmdelphin isoform X2 [Silurus asotus]|uniref:Palmdelphin n=1 Tax=Silurus asotus TaxID=30991 RepID=A0AAD5B786_SILAS|nr:palmdelphin isoform X2 [Silurus asotus]